MENEYIFDYQLVLEEDPSFRRFVKCISIKSIQECEQTLTNKLNNVKTEAGVYRSRYYGEITPETEADNDIIKFAHDENIDTINTPVLDFRSEVELSIDPEDDEVVTLKEEYEDPPNPSFNPAVLQLLPPNRFLKEGSRSWQGEDTLYKFNASDATRDNDKNFITIIKKYRFSHYSPFIRLQHASYRFNRRRNFMSERKKYFTLLTYNTDTQQLYSIRKVKNSAKKASRFHNSVTRVFNTLINNGWDVGVPTRLVNKFISAVKQAALKDVPDLIIPEGSGTQQHTKKYKIVMGNSNYESHFIQLAAIILQHRIKQPAPWLNITLMKNLWGVLSNIHLQRQILHSGSWSLAHYPDDEEKSEQKTAKALRRETIYQMIPNLRKSNHMRVAVKTILGCGCSKFLIRMFNTVPINNYFLSTWLNGAYNNIINKNLYHWVVEIVDKNIKDGNIDNITEMMEHIPSILSFIANSSHNDNKKSLTILDSYIKTYKRLEKGDILIASLHWHTWHDMYNMANQLGIRLRPNQLKSVNEIIHTHDKLSSIINRDKRLLRKYDNIIFKEFINPDKEYSGFKFIQMRTAKDLIHEGTTMHHCVGGYADRCTEGRSIIFSMRKNEKSYVTIEIDPLNFDIIQRYTMHDITVTNQEALDIINKWHNDCLNLHKDDKESYRDACRKEMKIIQDREKAIQDSEKASNLRGLIDNGLIDSDTPLLKQSFTDEEGVANATAFQQTATTTT
jgi:hypothetical protein